MLLAIFHLPELWLHGIDTQLTITHVPRSSQDGASQGEDLLEMTGAEATNQNKQE